MTGKNPSLDEIRDEARLILEEYNVIKAEIFGPYAKNEENKDSDIDILVEPHKGTTLADIAQLKTDLEENSDKEVDILTYDSVNSEIRDRISAEALKI